MAGMFSTSGAAIKLSDLVTAATVPSVWQPYFIKRTAEKSALIQSGIVTPDPILDALAVRGGTLINMPFFNDLTGADEILSDVNALTVAKLGVDKDVARLHLRGRAWGASDLSKAISGADPLMAIGDLVAEYWNRREQALLVATLGGVFLANAAANAGASSATHADGSANVASDLILDNSITNGTPGAFATTNLIGSDAVIDAKTKLGDNAEKLAAIMMHSVPYSRLQKLNLIDMVPDSEGKVNIPYYLGLRVIVDDGCPNVYANGTNSTNGYIYTSYLFGEGAIGRGEGEHPNPVETDRDTLMGEDYLINRRNYLLHPRGVKWTENTCTGNSPSNAELGLAANWMRVYSKKNIRLVALKTNG